MGSDRSGWSLRLDKTYDLGFKVWQGDLTKESDSRVGSAPFTETLNSRFGLGSVLGLWYRIVIIYVVPKRSAQEAPGPFRAEGMGRNGDTHCKGLCNSHGFK